MNIGCRERAREGDRGRERGREGGREEEIGRERGREGEGGWGEKERDRRLKQFSFAVYLRTFRDV